MTQPNLFTPAQSIEIGASPTGRNGGHRKIAETKGEKYYFTGVPCCRGHIYKRTTKNGHCVLCTREAGRIKSAEWKKKNKEKARQIALVATRKWRAKNPESSVEYMRRKRANNKEAMLAYERKLYARNKEKMAIKNKKRQLKNPEMFATYARNRRARLKKSTESHTKEDVFRLIQEQDGKCKYCRKDFGKRYDVDHIIPVSKNGSNGVGNLQILCRTCNRKKNNKDEDVFLREMREYAV